MFNLENLFARARAAQPVRGHFSPGFQDPTRYIQQDIQQVSSLKLDEELPNIAQYFDADGRLLRIPKARENNESILIDPMVAVGASSRVSAAGAHVLLRAPAKPATPAGADGLIALTEEIAGLGVVQPLKLAPLSEGSQLAVNGALPVVSATADWSKARTYGTSLRLTRATLRQRRDEESLSDILTAAVVAGVGRLADLVLMTALDESASLQGFSLAGAAASGVSFGSLRAITGTAAPEAQVGADGVLRVRGIPAEISDACKASFIGAFENAGVILDREVRVVAERTSIEGDMRFTVMASGVALLPDLGKFWSVAA